MPSAIVNATLQAAILSATSNLLAQILTSYRKDEPLSINPVPVFQFVLYTLLNCPPNYLWQQYIEHKFPAYTVVDDSDQVALEGNPVSRGKKLSVLNTSKKFLLDQTIGAAINIVLYISVIGGLKGLNGNEIIEAIRRDFWPVTFAGWRIWPLVSLLCFTIVPAERRVVVGSLVGVGWGVYLSLMATE